MGKTRKVQQGTLPIEGELTVPTGGNVDGQTLVGNAVMVAQMQAQAAAAGGAADTAVGGSTSSSSTDTGQATAAQTSSGSDTGSGTSSSGDQDTATGTGGRQSTDDIIDQYQVESDQMTEWTPALVGWMMDEPVRMTETEAGLLDQLQWHRGLMGLYNFKRCKEDAYEISADRYPNLRSDDSHRDAFRHIYWNVLMTKRLGENFAAAFATAHEGVPGNEADREAMDLYNNELGRRIATENPGASLEELQDLVAEAINNGQAMVIAANGELVYSDQVAEGDTGTADDAPRQDGDAPPEWSGS